MLYSKTLYLFIWLVLLSTLATAQNTITGVVKDAETSETLPGVNVYLANTTIGDATDETGTYKIITPAKGIYELVFSFIGFKKKVVQIELTGNTSSRVNASLEPDQYDLGELAVSGSNKEWRRNFERFRKEFIGQTEFAGQTEIQNPYIINFEKGEDNKLVASAPEPLIILNNALGYKLHVELDQFRWSPSGARGFFKVYPRFEELEPANEQQYKKWVKNREKAYEGSFRHFMKTFYHNNLDATKFKLQNPHQYLPLSKGEATFALMEKSGLSMDLLEIFKGYRLTADLFVSYGVDNVYKGPRAGTFEFRIQRSVIFPGKNDNTFFIDNNGILYDPLSLKIRGDWALYRFADQLPFDYKVY